MASVHPFQGDVEHAIVPADPSQPNIPGVFMEKKTVTNDQITLSVWFQRWLRCDFPLFSDEIIVAYHKHNVANINPFITIPIILLYNSYVICRSGLEGLRFGKIQRSSYPCYFIFFPDYTFFFFCCFFLRW